MIGYSSGKTRRALFLLAALGLPTLLAGCGSRTQPVEGSIVLKGGGSAAPLQGYYVNFELVDQPVSATGEVQADGTFQVGTYGDGDGAVLGKHRVSIGPPVPGYGATPKSRILEKYAQPATSGLEVTITRGVNKVVLEVESARK